MKFIALTLLRLFICLFGAFFIGIACSAFTKAKYFAFGMDIMLALTFVMLLANIFNDADKRVTLKTMIEVFSDEGYSESEIADMVCVSVEVVKKYKKEIEADIERILKENE